MLVVIAVVVVVVLVVVAPNNAASRFLKKAAISLTMLPMLPMPPMLLDMPLILIEGSVMFSGGCEEEVAATAINEEKRINETAASAFM